MFTESLVSQIPVMNRNVPVKSLFVHIFLFVSPGSEDEEDDQLNSDEGQRKVKSLSNTQVHTPLT